MRLKEFLNDNGNVNDIDNQWNNMTIADRTNYIKGDLLRRGYSQNQSAAILGNLLQENRSLSTHTQNASSGALGIAQWLGSRKKDIIAQGKHGTISGQLDFLDKEIKGKGAWTNNVGGKSAFFNSDDPRELTTIFRKDFERPGEHEANDSRRLANTFKVLGEKYTPVETNYPAQQVESSIPSDMKPLSFGNFKSQVAQDPSIIEYLAPNVQNEIAESYRLENEKQQQDQIKSQYEYQNQQIQQALQEKQQQRDQILSMIPQSGFVGSGQSNQLKLMQKGGWVPFSERSVNGEDIRSFYNNMINSSWYKERLDQNGYNSKLNPANWFSDGAQDEVNYRSRRVQNTKFNKIDMSKLPFSAQEAMRYGDLNETGTHWMPRTNEINYRLNDPMIDQIDAEPSTVVAHEFGHPESAGRLNDFEYGLLEDKLSNRVKNNHDKNPYENKADINALRYNLYKKGLYDPNTGKYKTKTGKFESSLLQNVKSDFVTERLLQNYDTKNLEYLLNTIAQNNTNNNPENIG